MPGSGVADGREGVMASLDLEYRAVSALLNLFEQSRECAQMFRDAELPLPPALVRLFGTTPASAPTPANATAEASDAAAHDGRSKSIG